MKFTSAICVIILAATASAIALPEANAQHCGRPGQPCGRSAIAEAAPVAQHCGRPGQPCGKRDAFPEPDAEALAQHCGRPGQPCGKVRRAAEAMAEAFAEPEAQHCGRPGQPCGKREVEIAERCNLVGGACYEAKRLARDLASIVASTQERDADAFYDSLNLEDRDTSDKVARDAEAQHCGRPGQPCGKRDAEAEAQHCGRPGQPCGKLRRAAAAIAEAVAEPQHCGRPGQPCGRDALPEAQHCGRPGQPCGKREAEAFAQHCGRPGQPCGKAKRDAHALAHAADVAVSQL